MSIGLGNRKIALNSSQNLDCVATCERMTVVSSSAPALKFSRAFELKEGAGRVLSAKVYATLDVSEVKYFFAGNFKNKQMH